GVLEPSFRHGGRREAARGDRARLSGKIRPEPVRGLRLYGNVAGGGGEHAGRGGPERAADRIQTRHRGTSGSRCGGEGGGPGYVGNEERGRGRTVAGERAEPHARLPGTAKEDSGGVARRLVQNRRQRLHRRPRVT